MMAKRFELIELLTDARWTDAERVTMTAWLHRPENRTLEKMTAKLVQANVEFQKRATRAA
jgi:hypothetical protein